MPLPLVSNSQSGRRASRSETTSCSDWLLDASSMAIATAMHVVARPKGARLDSQWTSKDVRGGNRPRVGTRAKRGGGTLCYAKKFVLVTAWRLWFGQANKYANLRTEFFASYDVVKDETRWSDAKKG